MTATPKSKIQCTIAHELILTAIVNFYLWQMYDAGDFKFLTTVSSPPGQNWMGGNFVTADCILVWSRVSYKF